MKQYLTLKPDMPGFPSIGPRLCKQFGCEGTEIFFDDLVPRDGPLFGDVEQKRHVTEVIRAAGAVRGHASYWAWPTAFLTGRHFGELVENMGGEAEVIAYYGDLTGEKMYARWLQEYSLCAELGLTYNWHLIDYAPIDGKWEFTLTREEILEGMKEILARLLETLETAGVLTADSPCIELENAGWGLEYGVQTAGDYAAVLDGTEAEDRFGKLRVGWDVNHLLHAMGLRDGKRVFLLPDDEITEDMRSIEKEEDPALSWIRYNLLHPCTACRTGAVQLSDRVLPETEYFRRGKLCEPYFGELKALERPEDQEEYGVRIVLGDYDSHEVLGTGTLDGRIAGVLRELDEVCGGLALLHELKNSPDPARDYAAQLDCLSF